MKFINCRILFLLLFSIFASYMDAKIVTYPVSPKILYAYHNDDFTVKVRQVGDKEWIDLYEYKVKVDMDTRSEASMVSFDFSGKIEVLVQKNNGELHSATIRPLSKGITPKIEGNTVTFTLDKPQNLSIECNGDHLHNLHLFANALETNKPVKGAPNVMYFEAGVHQPTDTVHKCFVIPSNTTVYLEGGAILKGYIKCDSVENVTVCGRGMILEASNGLSANFSKNITVEDIMVVNPRYNTMTAAVSRNVTIRNLKSFSSQGWGDGLDFFCCDGVLVDNVFMRNSDDCIAVYAHRWNFYGDVRNITVQNSTLWADIAHPINVGTHGNTETEGEVIENVLFKNIDILDHDEDDPDYQGCMAVNVGDNNLARNIVFDNIRVERIEEGQLFHLRVMYNKKYNTGPGRGIQNVTFRNIYYTGKNESPARIEGYDEKRKVNNIVFENININGKRLKSLDELNLNLGHFIENINLK